LNWAIDKDFSEEHRLHVLWTQSDGNCLLHATLLAICGLHDAPQDIGGLSTLRVAMKQLFDEPQTAELLRKRWEAQIARDYVWEANLQELPALDPATGKPLARPGQVEISEGQLGRDWGEMVELASRPKAFLDSIHVFALACALRRPIIVLASSVHRDPFGVPLTPIFFAGIYLPFGHQPALTCRWPLVLCFQDAHFMPLVPSHAKTDMGPVKVPLVDCHGEELPLRFALEEELGQKWKIVSQYMDVERDVHLPRLQATCNVALLQRTDTDQRIKDMLSDYLERARATFNGEQKPVVKAKREVGTEVGVEPPQGAAKRHKPGQTSETLLRSDAANRNVATTLQQDLAQSTWHQTEVTEHPPPQQHQSSGDQQGVEVTHSIQVRIPPTIQEGEEASFHMPQGCTTPQVYKFTVGEISNDRMVSLRVRFQILEHCIKTVCEVTNLSREEAVRLLTNARGDPNVAAQEHFEK